jgi:eukaryotic-like serine/threonine-protein kinase
MLTPGAILDGRYEIVATLGTGGMGHVYRARRPLLGDEVAVKVMQTSSEAPPDLRQRFLRESRACAQLRHPNIVTILDFNIDPGGQPYMVMELLSGPSLRDEMELGGPMEPAAVLEVLKPIGSALQLAHDRAITHRDLKPANIVGHRYESGERVYKVIDFGLAAVKEASANADTLQTDPNVFLGTLGYAAPEQLRGEAPDARTDIYTLGVIAYEMLTGHRPFETLNRMSLVNQTLSVEPVEPGKHRPNLTSEIDAVILRALAKVPSARFATVTDFIRALRTAVGEKPIHQDEKDDALLSRYELGETVGRGRLGSTIYRGAHRALGIPVAIRVLRHEEQSNWESLRSRFLVEARTLQVPHLNLLHVRDFGEDERLVYLVTDFIEGPSLRDELRRCGALPWDRVSTLLDQMLDATATLNSRGGFIVGVNPDMIRLTQDRGRDRVVMSTAGIASVQDVLATMREQELRGAEANEQELPYIAPEVLMGGPPAAPADVFTLGVLAYQLATGVLPFRAPNLPELIGQMLRTAPTEPWVLKADVPPNASSAILRALAADPAARFVGARDFAQAVRAQETQT